MIGVYPLRFKGILVGVVCQFELGVADLDSSLELGDQVVDRCIVVEVGADRGMDHTNREDQPFFI